MGEHIEKQTKMNTSLGIEPRLRWIGDSLSHLANFDCAFLRVFYDVRKAQEHRPYLYDVTQRIAKAITTKAFRAWSKEYRNAVPHLPAFIFTIFEDVFLLLAGIANDNTITRDIESVDLTKDLLKKFVKAETHLGRNLSFITRV